MAYYLMLTKLTERGRKSLREHPERCQELNREIESMMDGVKVTAQWFLLGPYDFASIIQAPDNWNMSFIAMEIGSRGTVETLTMPAMRVEDFISFMRAEDKVSHIRHHHGILGD
ncbi:MAG: GYD domain-containing protein [SAR202 cluster bacterium]|nr:GYD domain-containing protein [SAR202 cluster bacterium]